MLEVKEYTVEKLEDPTGILVGDRYEFILTIEVPEDDDLFSEQGLYVKVIYAVTNKDSKIVQYNVFEENTNRYIDFDLEEEEINLLSEYCMNHLPN